MSEKYVPRKGAGAEDSSMSLSRALNTWLEDFGPVGLFQTCASCRNMSKEGEPRCALYNVIPPINIIMRGCDKYDDDHEVPF